MRKNIKVFHLPSSKGTLPLIVIFDSCPCCFFFLFFSFFEVTAVNLLNFQKKKKKKKGRKNGIKADAIFLLCFFNLIVFMSPIHLSTSCNFIAIIKKFEDRKKIKKLKVKKKAISNEDEWWKGENFIGKQQWKISISDCLSLVAFFFSFIFYFFDVVVIVVAVTRRLPQKIPAVSVGFTESVNHNDQNHRRHDEQHHRYYHHHLQQYQIRYPKLSIASPAHTQIPINIYANMYV